MAMTSFMTPEERAMQGADEAAAAEGAGRLLAALIPALDAALKGDVPSYVSEDLRNQVATLLSLTKAYAAKFEQPL